MRPGLAPAAPPGARADAHPHRCSLASLLTIALHGKLEYYTSIMKELLVDLIDASAAKNPKLMLRRTESVVEKMLTNWMSICMYSCLRVSGARDLGQAPSGEAGGRIQQGQALCGRGRPASPVPHSVPQGPQNPGGGRFCVPGGLCVWRSSAGPAVDLLGSRVPGLLARYLRTRRGAG